jgi:uncharacterized membrane protein
MVYTWLKFLHIASVLAFLAAHGTSMTVLYAIRRERDRARILSLIQVSGQTTIPMYAAFGSIVLFGVLLAFKLHYWGQTWLWVSMTATAKPYFARVKEACQMRPSGVPRISDEELGEVLGSAKAHLITAIGVVGLLAILYLMVFKPRF